MDVNARAAQVILNKVLSTKKRKVHILEIIFTYILLSGTNDTSGTSVIGSDRNQQPDQLYAKEMCRAA